MGTRPHQVEQAPSIPQIVSPIYDADILNGTSGHLLPTLVVTQQDRVQTPVNYRFEVYADTALQTLIASALIPEQGQETHWTIQSEHLVDHASGEKHRFQDNRLYYWRVRSETAAEDQVVIPSQWVRSRFFINTMNDEPSSPVNHSPEHGAIVATTRPELVVAHAWDADRDNLTYGFDLYQLDEEGIETLVQQINGIPSG